MIVQSTLDDAEVKKLLVDRGLWAQFLKGEELSNADNDNPKIWSLLDKEPGSVYLFYGFSGFEKETDNGYVCQKVIYSPGEEGEIADMYQSILSSFGGEPRFAGWV